MSYTFAALDPRNTPEAANANDAILGDGNIYGIEVTVPHLAERCDLGNLDPQHTEGRNIAACVEALTCPLPPAGAQLVTVRPDADSVLAMAVLLSRASGISIQEEKVAVIGEADSAPAGPWRRDYTPHPWFHAVNSVAMEHRLPLADRVGMVLAWLAGAGKDDLPEVPEDDTTVIQVTLDGGVAVALADGPAGRGACGAGYKVAPVVVTLNNAFTLRGGEPHRKYTVARWNENHPMDWDGLKAELAALEPGWGGSASICGSPQGVGSTLELDQVVEVVKRHLA